MPPVSHGGGHEVSWKRIYGDRSSLVFPVLKRNEASPFLPTSLKGIEQGRRGTAVDNQWEADHTARSPLK